MSKRALVLTNHLHSFTGSEVVAMEVAEELVDLGYSVDLGANVVSTEMSEELSKKGISATESVDGIELSQYGFIWSQHGLLSLCAGLEEARKSDVFIASVHLSSFTSFEFIGLISCPATANVIVANSQETADALSSLGVDQKWILNFQNAAPRKFVRKEKGAFKKLEKLLIVSNHMPREISDAANLLVRMGVQIKAFGQNQNFYRRIVPEDIWEADGIISIGKTVQYSILGSTPVYCYDYLGGPGWLNENNFDTAARFNFSGRCCNRVLNGPQIAAEIISGFQMASENMNTLHSELSDSYVLDKFLINMLSNNTNKRYPDRASIDVSKHVAVNTRNLYYNGYYGTLV